MTIQTQNKLAKHIMRLLKTEEVIFPICRTSKGNFGLRYGVNTDDYEMYLDAVPLPTKDILTDDNNIELKKMLEKYLFEAPQLSYQGMKIIPDEKVERVMIVEVPVAQDKPKRGRPAGSKNKA